VTRIHPIILCGGSGTRLWPVSRKTKPKPFLPLLGDETLFEQTVRRVTEDGRFAPPLVVAGADHTAFIEERLNLAKGARLVIEPAAKNTAPAIALAATLLPEDAIMLVCPSDHHIADTAAFHAAALAAADLAAEDYLVALGIEPTRPETGYGYLERGRPLRGGFAIRRFEEKPDIDRAREYSASGEHSWNGGIFAFRAGQFLAELATHRPRMAEQVTMAVAGGREHCGRFHPAAEFFDGIAPESIDYAVMENTARAAMVPVSMGWSDIGNWAALADALEGASDADGNVTRSGAVHFDDCRGVFAFSDGPRISVVGLEDVCIIVSGDDVLVTTREGAQRVGRLPGATNQ